MSQRRSTWATDADVQWVEHYVEVASNKIGREKMGGVGFPRASTAGVGVCRED